MSFNNSNPPRDGRNVWSAGSRGLLLNHIDHCQTTIPPFSSQVHVEVLLVQIVMSMVHEEGKSSIESLSNLIIVI